MKGSISLTIVSLCLYTCVHHKAVDSVLSLPSHIHIHTLSHIHLKHRISPRPHLSPQDAAARSAAQVTSPECLSGGCILSCLPSWMLPSQTAFLLPQPLLGMNYGLPASDSQVVMCFIRESTECNKAHIRLGVTRWSFPPSCQACKTLKTWAGTVSDHKRVLLSP